MIAAPHPTRGTPPPTTAFQPTVSMPEEELPPMSLPREVVWGHSATAGLAEALVMMVDDEPLNAEMIGAFLADAGFRRFLHLQDPEQALPQMRRQPPGILLLDMGMPKVSGLEILEAMQSDRRLRHVPVIVLTGGAGHQDKLKALGLGAMDFLRKPVDPSELTLRIRNTLTAKAYRDHLALHDALTGLPNKQAYRATVAEVVAEGAQGALLHVGVDGLGRINDALGRVMGDQVLKRLAHRLVSCVRTEADGDLRSATRSPTLYRYDGDEFAVLVPQLDGMASAGAFISKLLEDGTVHFRRDDAPEVFVSCSIGVSMFPDDGTDPDVLMRNAGLALHHAKQARVDRYEFFKPRFNDEARRRLDLGAELRRALVRDEIELLFEPRVELSSGRLAAAQAQLRWKHASGRIIEGDELMDLAGTSEMDVALTEWLFDRVRLQTRAWKAGGLLAVPVGVKAPLAHIQPRDLAHLVSAALAAGVDPALLCIELQQVGGLTDRDAALLAGLRGTGLRFALDRFGDHASVAHLRRLKIDELKIDASFTRDLARDEAAQGLLLGMGDVARRLRITCVACGISDARQLAWLRKQDWPQGQGSYIGGASAGAPFGADWLERKLS